MSREDWNRGLSHAVEHDNTSYWQFVYAFWMPLGRLLVRAGDSCAAQCRSSLSDSFFAC